jgi:hypothetical protein
VPRITDEDSVTLLPSERKKLALVALRRFWQTARRRAICVAPLRPETRSAHLRTKRSG